MAVVQYPGPFAFLVEEAKMGIEGGKVSWTLHTLSWTAPIRNVLQTNKQQQQQQKKLTPKKRSSIRLNFTSTSSLVGLSSEGSTRFTTADGRRVGGFPYPIDRHVEFVCFTLSFVAWFPRGCVLSSPKCCRDWGMINVRDRIVAMRVSFEVDGTIANGVYRCCCCCCCCLCIAKRRSASALLRAIRAFCSSVNVAIPGNERKQRSTNKHIHYVSNFSVWVARKLDEFKKFLKSSLTSKAVWNALNTMNISKRILDSRC